MLLALQAGMRVITTFDFQTLRMPSSRSATHLRHQREATRCFALMSAEDTTVATCRFKSVKGHASVSFDKGETHRKVHQAAVISLGGGVVVEVWQRDRFGPDTPLKCVWRVPLLSIINDSRWLLFPVIFKVVAPTSATLPTASRARKMLAERMAAHATQLTEEELQDDVRMAADWEDDDDGDGGGTDESNVSDLDEGTDDDGDPEADEDLGEDGEYGEDNDLTDEGDDDDDDEDESGGGGGSKSKAVDVYYEDEDD